MKIVFKKIEIHNFKSFEDEVFEFDKHVGLNLVCGKNNDIPGSKNGTGKSCLFDALAFSLYGLTRENIKNCNIANKYTNSKEVRVVTFFDIGEHSYKVISGHNKNGGPYCQLLELANGDEIDLTKSTMTETRKYLADEVLHCDLSIFLRTILLSSDQNYNFFRLRKWEKKEFIEKLFDISVFGDMYNEIHRDVLDYDKTIVSLQNKLIMLNKNKDEYKERIDSYIHAMTDKVNRLNSELESLRNEKDKIENLNLKSNSSEVEKYEEMMQKASDARSLLAKKLIDLNTTSLKILMSVHKLLTSRESKQKIIDKHAELLSKLCDDCKKAFSDYYNITTYTDDIKKLDLKVELFKDDLKTNKSEVEDINAKVLKCDNMIEKINIKILALTEDYNKANQRLAIIDESMTRISNDILSLKNSENPYSELFLKNQEALEHESIELEKTTDKYKYLKFAEIIVSQDTLRKFIISDLIGLLNSKIKTYLSKFGAKYNVVFDADMNYVFLTEGGEYEYDSFSGGERARLMIAACFAFRDFMYIRNGFSSNILILDEFIDGAIDGLAIESILNVLQDFSKLWKLNVFVISHRKSEMDDTIFDNIIQVLKTKNISTIAYLQQDAT